MENSNPGYGQFVEVNKEQTQSITRVSKIPQKTSSMIMLNLSREQLKGKASSSGLVTLAAARGAGCSELRKPIPSSTTKLTTKIPLPNKKCHLNEIRITCKLCGNVFLDPRVLSCLHSFCMGCIIKISNSNVQLTERTSTSGTYSSSGDTIQAQPTGNSSNRRASQKSITSTTTNHAKPPATSIKNPLCPICGTTTVLPISGISRLPKNTIIQRLLANNSAIEKCGTKICDLCDTSTPAVHCNVCEKNLCHTCTEAHRKDQRTRFHTVLKIELKKSPDYDSDNSSKCLSHPNYNLKLFCTNCNQVSCSECVAIHHYGHKIESIPKAIKVYSRVLKDNINRVRPTTDYATLTISKLISIHKNIDKKCDTVRQEIGAHLDDYQKALDHHRNTLLHQVQRAKELKLAAIECQKSDLEKRSSEAKTAIEFAELFLEDGSPLEIMSFVGIILKRFQYCEQSKVPLDANINDSLRFLPEIRAPPTSAQNSIPLYGIITTQTADPQLCTIEGMGLTNLKVNKRVELTLIARDRDNEQLCHGGLKLELELRYNDYTKRLLNYQLTDKRDGTYQIIFTPDATGTIMLSISIAGKPIKDNPLTLIARNLKPHSGIYHCCSFCSNNGITGNINKKQACACGGTMKGFNGCGHGHSGHPGRRHWSCCGNILQNSECLAANELDF